MTAGVPHALALLSALALPVIAAARGHQPFGLLTIDQVAAEVGRPGVYLFDANTKDVYDAAHLPGAKFISYKVKASDLPADKSAMLIFYCKNPH